MTQATPLTPDVRPELRAGGEPFPRIMQAVASLEPGQALRLLATFEPIPLYAVLGRKGLGTARSITARATGRSCSHRTRRAQPRSASPGRRRKAMPAMTPAGRRRSRCSTTATCSHPNRWCESSPRWSDWPLAR